MRRSDRPQRSLRRCRPQHPCPSARSRPASHHPHASRADIAPCADRRLCPLRQPQENQLMERTQLFDLMGELKLYGMKAAFDEIMATAVKRQHEPQRIVGDLLSAEINEKQARSIKYQLTIAKLPLAKDLEDFQFEGTPINRTLVNDLAGGGFIAQQRNVVLVGGTGTGKTHLAIAIARSCIRSGARGRFYNVVDLVNRLDTETRNGRLSLSSAWLAPQSWEPQQRPHPWHRCAGGGAVHSIKLGPRAMSDRRPFVPNSRHATPRRFCARAEPRRADRIFQSSGSRQRHGFSGRAPTTTI